MREYTIEELQTMVTAVNQYDNYLDNYVFDINDEEFLSRNFEGRYDDLAKAIFYGKYRYPDMYITFNGYGNLETFTSYEMEDEIRSGAEEIIKTYTEYVENGYIEDYEFLLEGGDL